MRGRSAPSSGNTGRWRCALLAAALSPCVAAPAEPASGPALIEASLRAHAAPRFAFEVQTYVLTDAAGRRTVRTARHYLRTEDDGSVRRLLVADAPDEVHGAALLSVSDARGRARRTLYLPALGRELALGADHEAAAALFGTDFLASDLETEQPRDHDYVLEGDREIERVAHFVVRARPRDAALARAAGYTERRIFLRKESLFVARIDYLDRIGGLLRRQSFRDPRPDETGAWRPGMILMENLRERHTTLLKIEQRIHSPHYAPAALFAPRRHGATAGER